ncbi:protein-disulfide reductase DsbD [Natronospira bacteriovora]|uniref:Thiol:disulfide interchange protein DsbD n=1 Tax=Natronospira bacteriovora TaxID=3069753 RepID=A0ABU0W6H9_9GAMM|nr:protein-disulfide reductase DsbD [Natronospira sp. AB-CW4]MDQ2069635.1 protein-disulfide reductase DsbD [Natronospira sp. AB-CW4]
MTARLFRCGRLAALMLLALLSLPAAAQSISGLPGVSGGDFKHPDEAFILSVRSPSPDLIQVDWQIADEYYLYEHRFDFQVMEGGVTLGEARYPQGLLIEDEFFGESIVHRHQVTIDVPIQGGQTGDEILLRVDFQGCADAGLCYPPLNRQTPVVLGADEPRDQGSSRAATTPPASEQDRMAGLVAEGHLVLVALAFFGFGLLLSLTPCVLPMVPILSSLIIGKGEHISTARAFGLSLTYVLAMALTYTAAGVAAGLLGHNLQAALQHPLILSVFAAVFVILSLAMFGFYQLQVPQRFQDALAGLSNRQQSGRYTGVALMGLLSALIVGPCVAAPLAGALLVIGQTGDALRGGVALFSMSMGMGVLLLVVGTSAGRLMPKAGAWMNAIKAAFGVLLLAVAVWMLERIVPAAMAMVMWSALLVFSGVYLGALDSLSPGVGGWRRFWKAAGLMLMVWGLILLLAAALGGKDPLRPLQGTVITGTAGDAAASPDFAAIEDVEQLDSAIAAIDDRPLMLEFYADWCIDCVRMERRTFPDPGVRESLQAFDLLKADVTRYNARHRELLERFQLFGPPAILFFDHNGDEIRHLRLVGEMGPAEFRNHLQQVREAFASGDQRS